MHGADVPIERCMGYPGPTKAVTGLIRATAIVFMRLSLLLIGTEKTHPSLLFGFLYVKLRQKLCPCELFLGWSGSTLFPPSGVWISAKQWLCGVAIKSSTTGLWVNTYRYASDGDAMIRWMRLSQYVPWCLLAIVVLVYCGPVSCIGVLSLAGCDGRPVCRDKKAIGGGR